MTTTPAAATHAEPSTRPRPAIRTIAIGGAIGAVIAVIATLVVFAIGNVGAPIEIVAQGDATPSSLPIGLVVVASILPIFIGAVALWVFERLFARGFQIWAILAIGLAVVSIAAPAGLDVDTGSKVALAAMHLSVGLAAVIGQTIARRQA